MNLSFLSSNRPTVRPPRTAAACSLLGLLLTSSLTVHAQGAEKSVVGKSSEKDYVLTHKSSYTSPNVQRSPFWPIGWVPIAPVAVEVAAVVASVKAEDFVVTSISLDYPPLAVVNKHTYGVGDRIQVGAAPAATANAPAKGGGDFVTVRQISDGVVVLDHRGTMLRCTTNTAMATTRSK